jgi:sugar O-acyltransferase (sialic acid O-acetyltransferase NeuD family)
MHLLLIGGGMLAQQIKHYIDELNSDVKVIGFVDDDCEVNVVRFASPCLGKLRDVNTLYNNKIFDSVFFAIGYKHLLFKEKLYDDIESIIPIFTFIHPKAYIDSSATIGKGCFVGPCTIIEQGVIVKENTFVYGGVNISHDSKIGSNCFIAPSVVIAGFVDIGRRCFIGINSSIIDSTSIADDTIIGAASLVLNNINEPGTYVGSPASKIKK